MKAWVVAFMYAGCVARVHNQGVNVEPFDCVSDDLVDQRGAKAFYARTALSDTIR